MPTPTTPTTPTPPPTIFVNDNSREAIAWLRELSNHNHLPPLNLNEHSITDLQPHDLAPHTHVHFFAGIGGWPLALQLAGWPSDQPVWTGSCPCQPFSVAGRGAGTNDPRHLWPQFHRLLSVCLPPVVFGEQVAGAAGREWFAGVRADLEALGYLVGAADLCAASVGAPHIRQRIYWFGVRAGVGPIRLADTASNGRQQRRSESDGRGVGGDGASDRLAHHEGQGRSGVESGQQTGSGQRARPERDCPTDPVANSLRPGLERCAERSVGDECPAAERGGQVGAWDECDILPCRDGKARRVECQSQQMANGFSAELDSLRSLGLTEAEIQTCLQTGPLAIGQLCRIGLLRGYGNAIVVPLAVAFIQAAVETINTTHTG